MGKIIVAPVGDHIDDLYAGIKEFPTEKVILLTPDDKMKVAQETAENLSKFKIPVKIVEMKGHIWESVFKEVALVKKYEQGEIMVNVSTGDREARCAATSAAFVNGLKAFSIDEEGMVMLLPVLKFSYYKLLTDKKMGLMRVLYENKECCASLDELSKKVKMSLPLLSYHVNGTLKAEGLKNMGLVETQEKKGKIEVKLTFLGKMLLKGYIE